jgi:hypothetical protein
MQNGDSFSNQMALMVTFVAAMKGGNEELAEQIVLRSEKEGLKIENK